MITCHSIEPLRSQIKQWRKAGDTIAFVPTMGNLHVGHLSLIEMAQKKASRVVVSIYVNPLQFAPGEDFSSYPRTLDADLDQLANRAVDLVFIPDSEMIYPQGEQQSSAIEVPVLSHIIEGQFRPGFFKGVATVVLKLFNMVQPDIAIFGEKDFQQLLVIQQMVMDLNLPIKVIGAGTKREANGLAMSSRNNYLSIEERSHAQVLRETLLYYRDQVKPGKNLAKLESDCVKILENHGFTVDYLTLRETSQLNEVSALTNDKKPVEQVILAAVKLGKTRLIDNVKWVI